MDKSPALAGFLATLHDHAELFDPQRPILIARAPGRLDLMGGIADYSGALVLELPLACATFAAIQLVDEPGVIVRSLAPEQPTATLECRMPLSALAPGGLALDEASAHTLLNADPAQRWAAYVLGPILVLARTRGLSLTQGLRLLVASDVPPGKGVSSSAALEVAVLRAFAAALDVSLDGRELALLCQRAENRVVGAPCGVMDQMTVACGEAGRLLALRCQPAELEEPVPLPAGLEVWGVDSGLRHAVGGSDYGSVRTAAFMGYRMLAEQVGLVAHPSGDGRVRIDDPLWGGYLANLRPSSWAQQFRTHIPEQLDGAAFLRRYNGITDEVTAVDPARIYAVRACTAHPIEEQQRVRLFRALLLGGATVEEERLLLGELMAQSHASYSACGLGSQGTDRLVALVQAAGPAAGLYGAKITGGGSGGTVAVLARAGSVAALQQIAAQYAAESGHPPRLLGGSSPGAMAAPVVRVELAQDAPRRHSGLQG
jgi:L-arabinokinase